MLIRISLIIAIIAGLAVGALNFVKVKEKIVTLQTNLAEQTEGRQKAESELRTTKTTLDKTTKELTATKQTLETTTQEKNAAVAEASKATQHAGQLTEELNKTKSDLGSVQADLARYQSSGMSADQVSVLAKSFKESQSELAGAQEENKLLGKRIASLKQELARYKGEETIVLLPATLKGKVLVTDPKWDFVILDVGETQGVLPNGELLVSRNGQLVAKVVVRSIEKDRCVANLMPGWKVSEVLEGDQVIPAHPQS